MRQCEDKCGAMDLVLMVAIGLPPIEGCASGPWQDSW